MIAGHARYLSLILLTVGSLFTACQSTRTTDPRGDLLRAINGASVEGYAFSFDENATRSSASLTNPAVNDVMTFAGSSSSIPLRYTTIRDRLTGSATTYKTELVRSGNSVSYFVTDLSTNREVQRVSADDDGDSQQPPPGASCGPFPVCADALHDYLCNQKPRLQCEANSACQAVFGHYVCDSVTPGFCDHYTTIVVPNTIGCSLRATMVDIDQLKLRQP